MTPDEILRLVDELRARGAVSVKVGEVMAVFPAAGPTAPKRPDDAPVKGTRSLEDRLFDPLNIGKAVREPGA